MEGVIATLYNRARVVTATTGTGTMTLGAAIAGYFTFAEAGVQDADTVSYTIEDGNDFEIGTGTYTASGTTLTRTVTESKIGGVAGTSAINLSGNATVFITARAEDIGDVTGPASSTDNAIARYHETTGKIIQNSSVTIDDSNNVAGMATLTLPNTGLHLLDTNASHDLIIAPGSDLSADRSLTLTTGDADRTLALGGNTTLNGGTHSGTNTGDEAAASETVAGVVELATTAEAETGTDTARAVTPAGVLASINANAGGGGIVTAVESGALSSQATLDIALGSADMYEIDLIAIAPATDVVVLRARFSQSSTFLTGATNYAYTVLDDANVLRSAGADHMIIAAAGDLGNATAEVTTKTFRIFRPSAAGFIKTMIHSGYYWSDSGLPFTGFGGGQLRVNTDAIDGVRFYYSSGNIASGYYAVRSYSFT